MIFDSYYAFYIFGLLGVLFLLKSSSNSYEKYFSKDMLHKIFKGNNQKKINFILLLVSFILFVLALARPIIEKGSLYSIDKSDIDIVVALDISNSMQCNDIYPTRFAFAKNKLYTLLSTLRGEKVAFVGFANQTYLISPFTDDYSRLMYLLSHIDLDSVDTKGSSIYNLLVDIQPFLQDKKDKVVVLFTDGTDKKDFSSAIRYAQKNSIKIYIYTIATKKGGAIKVGKSILKDTNGNIVISSLNSSIKELSTKTSGLYMNYSLSSDDMVDLIKAIKDDIINKKDSKVKVNIELYYIPLILGLIIFIFTTTGFKRYY